MAMQLSPRELEVARMVAEGLTNREIGLRLFISERTVDGHLEHIREKLAVNSRAQVTAWIVRHDATAPAPVTPAVPAAASAQPRWSFAHPRAWMAAALVLALLAAGAGLVRLTAPPLPIIRTVVGTDCAQPQYPGGCFEADEQRALEAKLSRPTSVAVDGRGVMYIADYGNGRIRRVQGGVMTTVIGGGKDPLTEGAFGRDVQLDFASTVALNPKDELYVLTTRGPDLEVWRMDAGGFMHQVVSLGRSNFLARPDSLNLPVGGLVITAEGVLFIADQAGNRVMKFDGALSPYAGTGEPGFVDGGDARTAKFDSPTALALDRQENLYIADTQNKRIRKVDHATGTIRTVAGSGRFEGNTGDDGPATQAQLSFPFGLAIASNGDVVIADTGNHRLRVVAPDGTISALAGTGRWGFGGDRSAAIEAEFDGPEGLALDGSGNLFIADTENQRIREIPRVFG
jgi:DNA-binding CsgD family transcriptional regulator